MSVTQTYQETTDQLPDALAFVKPNRARFWIQLRDAGEPMTATELENETGHSSATVYRMIQELRDLGLVEDAVRFDSRPIEAYEAVSPTEDSL